MKKLTATLLLFALLASLASCGSVPPAATNTPYAAPTEAPLAASTVEPTAEPGIIYLYGESHGIEAILEREFELWYGYYHDDSMRHLFIEQAYYSAEFLNLWMQTDNDELLDALFIEQTGTQGSTEINKEFYKKIKRDCPETIFHGTDVGHQYESTGKRYIEYLELNSMQDSEQYELAKDAVEQGKLFYHEYASEDRDWAYREKMMAANFIREYNKLNGESIMGIYGSAHTYLNSFDVMTGTVPNMATALNKPYKRRIRTEDLSELGKPSKPLRIDTIELDGRDYVALYFGRVDIHEWADEYQYREFWLLEDAYDDFKSKSKTNNFLPYNNYPMAIEVEQVYMIIYAKTDGSFRTEYLRSDKGAVYQGFPTTVEFRLS